MTLKTWPRNDRQDLRGRATSQSQCERRKHPRGQVNPGGVLPKELLLNMPSPEARWLGGGRKGDSQTRPGLRNDRMKTG